MYGTILKQESLSFIYTTHCVQENFRVATAVPGSMEATFNFNRHSLHFPVTFSNHLPLKNKFRLSLLV